MFFGNRNNAATSLIPHFSRSCDGELICSEEIEALCSGGGNKSHLQMSQVLTFKSQARPESMCQASQVIQKSGCTQVSNFISKVLYMK